MGMMRIMDYGLILPNDKDVKKLTAVPAAPIQTVVRTTG